jgi:hypothetical protein
MRAALSDICKQAFLKIFIFAHDFTNLEEFRNTGTRDRPMQLFHALALHENPPDAEERQCMHILCWSMLSETGQIQTLIDATIEVQNKFPCVPPSILKTNCWLKLSS